MIRLTPIAGQLLVSDLPKLRKTYGGEIHWTPAGWVLRGAYFGGSLVDLGPVTTVTT